MKPNNKNWQKLRYAQYERLSSIGTISGKMSAKKVMCVETGEIFNSIIEASQKTGISVSGISHSARLDKKMKGFTFRKLANE